MSYEERTQRLNEFGGLFGFAHCLYDVREWVQLAADQSNQEIVVVHIQPMTGQPNVVS